MTNLPVSVFITWIILAGLPAGLIMFLVTATRTAIRALAAIILGLLCTASTFFAISVSTKTGQTFGLAQVLLIGYLLLALGIIAWLSSWSKSRKIFGNLLVAAWLFLGFIALFALFHISNPNN